MRIVSPVTKINMDFLSLYRSCIENGFTITLLGVDKEYHPYFKNWVLNDYILDLEDEDIVMIIDGYDMFCLSGIDEIKNKFIKFGYPIVVSADVICYPDESLSNKFEYKSDYFNYLNLGGLVGYVGELKKALKRIFEYENEFIKTRFMVPCADQLIWQKYYLYDQKNQMVIDHDCDIWQTLGGRPNMERMMEKVGDRYRNKITKSFPCFIHAAGTVGRKAMKRLFDV